MKFSLLKPSQALLIVCKQKSYLEPLLHLYLKKIVCLNKMNDEFCNDCNNCKKVQSNQYYDFLTINSLDEKISKEKVLEIQNNFSYDGLEEGNKKIYLIKQIEKCSKEAINSLLKFIEEPPSNTYAILTTKNEDLVPPTIISRCQRFLLLPDKTFNWKEFAKNYNLNNEDIDTLSQIYWQIDDLISSIKDNSYLEILNISKSFLKPKKNITDIKNLQDQFKKLSYNKIEIILNYLLFRVEIEKHEKILEILSIIHLNPIRNVIFWQIIKLIES